jgi:dihydrodipicolinate synthase/N-acetylneuraminate lyase
MIGPEDLKGLCAMMPAFTTADGESLDATATVDTANLAKAVDRMIGDGANMIATTGSFGEFHTLLWEEQKTLIEATVQTVRKRVPLFIGITALNTREALMKIRFAQEAGADGVLTGVPHYYPSTIENAVQYYLDVADKFPKLGVMIYHNPLLHRVTIPVNAFNRLVTRPNIVAMKDSHRDTFSFMKLMNIVRGKISVFVFQAQSHPYMSLGAAGCWSIFAWMGPWPVLRLLDACSSGDLETAKTICVELDEASQAGGKVQFELFWRENSSKLAINEAGYCDAGPLRPPFRHVPPEVQESAKKIAQAWNRLVEKYKPAEPRAKLG